MLTLEEALQRVLAAVPPPARETVSLSEAAERALAEAISSPVDLPPFDNSAMDGYAVRAEDTAPATVEKPAVLQIAGRIAAGEPPRCRVEPGTCTRLFTGSVLPPGADAVVMQEDTAADPSDAAIVRVTDAVKPWENVRFRGEDIKRGEVILETGAPLGAAQLALLAATGIGNLQVARRPVVGVMATGSELREAGAALAEGQIYESNRVTIATLARQAGAVVKIFPLVADSLAGTRAALEQIFSECDCVVSTGGVSVGEHDYVKDAFAALGGEIGLWRVAIKPGKPFVFGRIRSASLSPGGGTGRGEGADDVSKLFFGLPGNPVSAFVTFLVLVRPALRRWQGAAEISLPSHPGTLAEPLANRGDRRHFVRVEVDDAGRVRPAGVQASHRLASLARATGLVEVPPETVLPSGAAVRVLRWECWP
ncbi:MAG: molybdopterin molybdotransferase MoeA [Verrucomicrobia bacterium]|nr:molybdopterin molybdotransferase MoeA [Verrucomicrobiota bacterium]